MTQDEIIEMAAESGWVWSCLSKDQKDCILYFSKLVSDKEREACAKVCGEYNFGQAPKMIQDAIRARGEA